MKYAAAEVQVGNGKAKDLGRGRKTAEVGRDVNPALWIVDPRLVHDPVHGDTLTLRAGKIRQLPHEIGESLSGQCRNVLSGIPLALAAMTARAMLSVVLVPTDRMGVKCHSGLGLMIDALLPTGGACPQGERC